jgi:hypothetical protein
MTFTPADGCVIRGIPEACRLAATFPATSVDIAIQGGRMPALPRLVLPEDWKRRTPVFTERKAPRNIVVPMVSQRTYEDERHAGTAQVSARNISARHISAKPPSD